MSATKSAGKSPGAAVASNISSVGRESVGLDLNPLGAEPGASSEAVQASRHEPSLRSTVTTEQLSALYRGDSRMLQTRRPG